MSEETKNLMTGLLDEITRVTDIIKVYKNIPKGAGNLTAAIMELSVRQAKMAIRDNDIAKMVEAFKELKTYEL